MLTHTQPPTYNLRRCRHYTSLNHEQSLRALRFAEPYTEQEDYDEQEPYTHHEHYSVSVPYSEEEQYEENEPYTTIEKQAVPVEVTHTGKTWYGKKKRRTTLETKWVDVEVQKLRPVTRTRTVTKYRTEERTRPVTLYRTVTKQRAVTRYRTATRTVPRTVQYTRPVTDFYQTALEQILEEVRATFRVPVDDVHPDDSVSRVADGMDAVSGGASDDSWSVILRSNQEYGPNCFVQDALFKVCADNDPSNSYFLHACNLVVGTQVVAADGQILQVTQIASHDVEAVLQLAADGVAPLRISPNHRVVVPGGETWARELARGDVIVCNGEQRRSLTEVETIPGPHPVFEIRFQPDAAATSSQLVIGRGTGMKAEFKTGTRDVEHESNQVIVRVLTELRDTLCRALCFGEVRGRPGSL